MKKITPLFVIIPLLILGCGSNKVSDKKKGIESELNKRLSNLIDQAWEVTWDSFYSPKTNQFYDYLSSYEKGHGLDHLPRPEEVQRQHPNVFGYDTGMEDCMITAGVLLSLIVDRYEVTHEKKLANDADSVLQGVRLSLMVHEKPGFLARCVCVDDQQSIYINSSRDQYTHAVYGLWLLYRSELSSTRMKEEIRSSLSQIADRMERNVTPENNFDFLRADGTPDTRGISKMWEVKGHEAARLPMIYAAAWDVTQERRYYDLYQRYLEQAITQSDDFEEKTPTYALLQMQSSLDLLLALETDPSRKLAIVKVQHKVAAVCVKRALSAGVQGNELDLTMLGTDWRIEGGGLYPRGAYRKVWYCIRESGEAALSQLMLNDEFTPQQQELLQEAITRLDYQKVSSSGIFYLQAAYWKARKKGYFK